LAVSIPRSGFCSFRLVQSSSSPPPSGVSIPRSGFCSFRLCRYCCALMSLYRCFNPSFGILLIQTCLAYNPNSWRGGFNPSFGILLIQTSVPQSRLLRIMLFQSLVRDSAHSDSGRVSCLSPFRFVSIPRSGFCSFRRFLCIAIWWGMDSFNPSFGILLIQTFEPALKPRKRTNVSIPRSGFCSFRRSDHRS